MKESLRRIRDAFRRTPDFVPLEGARELVVEDACSFELYKERVRDRSHDNVMRNTEAEFFLCVIKVLLDEVDLSKPRCCEKCGFEYRDRGQHYCTSLGRAVKNP